MSDSTSLGIALKAQALAGTAQASGAAAIAAANACIGKNALQCVFADIYPNIDPTGFNDCSNTWSGLVAYAAGRMIVANGTYRIKDMFFGDVDIWISGATFIHTVNSRVMLSRPTLGAPQTVTAVATVQIGASNYGGFPTPLLMTKITCATSWKYNKDDVIRLDSQDKYPFGTQYAVEQGFTSYSCYLADLVKVDAIGQDYTGLANGGFTQADVVTGATSGVTGTVWGVGLNSQATDTILFKGLTGNFTNGENLLVGGSVKGVASGNAYILAAEELTHQARYQTNMSVSKLGNAAFRLDNCAVIAGGDIDSLVGAAARKAAFQFEGTVDPIINNFRCRSAWQRCFSWASCWAPKVNGMHIDRLPNNANPLEGGYGYGHDLISATAYAVISGLTGGNARHGVTTNTFGDVNGDNYAARAPFTLNGCPKHNIIQNCTLTGNISEPFDTHPGDMFTKFINCHAYYSYGTGLNISGAGGFKTRGFGTHFIDCTSDGGTIGFNDYSAMYDAGFQYISHYSGCIAKRYTRVGFAMTQAPFDRNQRTTLYERCWIRDYATTGSTPYYQYGWQVFNGSHRVIMRDCGADTFTGAPWGMAGSQDWTITNFLIDYSMSSNSSPPRIEGTLGSVMIDGLTIIRHPSNPSLPAGAIRNMTANTAYLYLNNVRFTGGVVTTLPEIPLILESAGGNITPYYRRDGRYIVVSNTIPSGLSPVGANWPVGARVEFKVPQNGFNAAVVTVSAASSTWKTCDAISA